MSDNIESKVCLVVQPEQYDMATIGGAELSLVKTRVIRVEGPYNNQGELLDNIDHGEKYYYYAVLNIDPVGINLKRLKWAVSYDGDGVEKSFLLPFKGGKIVEGKVKVRIDIQNTCDRFNIYAYTTLLPKEDVFVEVLIGNIAELVYSGTISWGKLQSGMSTQNKKLTEAQLDAGLDIIGSGNVRIMKLMSENVVKGFYENGPLGVKAVLSDLDDIEKKVINNFYTGNHAKLSFNENSGQAAKLLHLKTFQDYFKRYLDTIKSLLKKNKVSNLNSTTFLAELKTLFGVGKNHVNFSDVSEISANDFYGFMGGTQTTKVDIEIIHWKRKDGVDVDYYIVTSKMHIGDWYGADWGDVNGWRSKLKGNVYSLNAFFWLQHHYGCHPFETELIYASEDKLM